MCGFNFLTYLTYAETKNYLSVKHGNQRWSVGEGFGSFAPGSAYIIWKLCSWVCIYNITPSTARDEAVWELEESGNKIAHRWKGSLYFKSSET